MSTLDSACVSAFARELEKLAAKGELDAFHQFSSLDPLIKEAIARALLSKLRGSSNPFGRAPGMFQDFGRDLMAGGRMVSSPKLVSPGVFREPSAAARLVGEVATTTGHHYAHKSTLGNVLNPLGGAIGGVAEGVTRTLGRESARQGAALGGRAGTLLTRAGKGIERAAPGAGLLGEIAGVAGVGSAVGVPLSAQGLVGGKLVGAVPGVEHALHHAGHYVHHAASDAVGTASHGIANRARQLMGAFGGRQPAQLPVGAHA